MTEREDRMDLIIKNGTVVNASGSFRADVGVSDGTIVCLADRIDVSGGDQVVDAYVVSPA